MLRNCGKKSNWGQDEEATPRLHAKNLETAAGAFKVSTSIGVDILHPEVQLVSTDELCEQITVLWIRWR